MIFIDVNGLAPGGFSVLLRHLRGYQTNRLANNRCWPPPLGPCLVSWRIVACVPAAFWFVRLQERFALLFFERDCESPKAAMGCHRLAQSAEVPFRFRWPG
jgi:hypothetical protein